MGTSSEKDKTEIMSSKKENNTENINTPFSEFWHRLMNRILPSEKAPDQSEYPLVRYGLPYLGASVFFIYSIQTIFTNQQNIAANMRSSESSEFIGIFPYDWYGYAFGTPFLLTIIVPLLIGKSFRHGHHLTFFFWGLAFPALAMLILQGAVPFLEINYP